jgi:hypothetical protein
LSPAWFFAPGRTRESIFVGFSDDRRFFVPVLVLFVFFVLIFIVVGDLAAASCCP